VTIGARGQLSTSFIALDSLDRRGGSVYRCSAILVIVTLVVSMCQSVRAGGKSIGSFDPRRPKLFAALVGFALVSFSQLIAVGGCVFPGTENPPEAPSGLQGSPYSTTKIVLTWNDNANDEDGFAIENKSGTQPFQQAATAGLDATEYILTGLVPDTTYTLRVRAFKGTVYSDYSDTVAITTYDNSTPASVQPTSGPVGAAITIFDPQERIQAADVCLLYPDGGDPQTGTPVENLIVTGNRLSGTIPAIGPGAYSLTVRASPVEPSRFADVIFTIDL